MIRPLLLAALAAGLLLSTGCANIDGTVNEPDTFEYRVSYMNSKGPLARPLNKNHIDHKTGAGDLEGEKVTFLFGETIAEGDELGFNTSFSIAAGPSILFPNRGDGTEQDSWAAGAEFEFRLVATDYGPCQPFIGLGLGYLYTHHQWSGNDGNNHLFNVTPNIGIQIPLDEDYPEDAKFILMYGLQHISDLGGPSRNGDNDGWNTDIFSAGLIFEF